MIGTPRLHLRATDSTNLRARELAMAGAPHGTLVTAGEQTAGRGRQGREWVAPPGSSVLMSLVLRELDALLPLRAAVAVAETVGSEEIKWPNDVWIDRRKLAGILIEGRPQDGWAVLGIGLNVSIGIDQLPPELRETATSLAIEGHAAAIEQVLDALVRKLDGWLTAPPARVLDAWRSRDALRGERVRWPDGEGVAGGIDDSGALLVETQGGRVTLDAGEVHLLR